MKSTFATELFVKLFGVMPTDRRRPKKPAGAPSNEVMVPDRAPRSGDGVTYHVTPRPGDDRWNVKKEGGARPSAVCDNKREAIVRARRIARNKRAVESSVVVHNRDGQVSNVYSYGTAPALQSRTLGAEPVDDHEDDLPDETESDEVFVDEYEGLKTEDEAEFRPVAGEPVVYHVTPRRSDNRWNVRRRGAELPSAVIENKAPAVKKARALAKRHPQSQVIVHNKDGKVARKHRYRI